MFSLKIQFQIEIRLNYNCTFDWIILYFCRYEGKHIIYYQTQTLQKKLQREREKQAIYCVESKAKQRKAVSHNWIVIIELSLFYFQSWRRMRFGLETLGCVHKRRFCLAWPLKPLLKHSSMGPQLHCSTTFIDWQSYT